MSVTTTSNPRVTELRHVLADYDLHHSQPSEPAAAPPPNSNTQLATTPPDWEDQWRRVPAYISVDPSMIHGDRNQFNNRIEQNFIRVMFGGVWMQSMASWLCRKTIGRWNDRIFRIKIGGEW